MTDYLSLAQQRAPQAAEEQDNPYMPLAQQQQTLQQNRARTVLETALRDDPDLAAERLRVSQTSGVPLRVVERNLDELRVKERARAIDLVDMAQESPVLYRQITDPTFATTSVDDLDTLKNLERSVGKSVRYVMGADGKGGLPSDLVDATKTVGLGATVGIGKMAFDAAGVVNDLIGWQSGAQAARGTAKQLQGVIDKYGFQPESSTGEAVKSGLQSAGTNLALLPIGLMRGLYGTANQAASVVAGLMAGGAGAAAFNEARDKGRNTLQAGVYAIPEATFEYVFERIPAAKLFGDIAANTGLLKLIGRQTLSEGWTEQVTTLAQDFNEWMNLNPDKTLGQFIQERPEAAYQTFIATLVGVGVQTTTIKGINKIIEKASDQSLKFDQDLLESQMQLAAASMLRTRSPEQFRAHVQNVVDANESAKKEIYIDGEVLNQLPQELLAQLPESVREQIPAALEARSTVAIPMADVLTVAPGTELEQILNDNARMRPDAASRVEAQLAQEYLAQEAERVMQQAADTSAWQQSSEAVRTEILGQLNSTGRFTADVNEAYATLQSNFFSTMAARTGMTPTELYQRYSLKVAAKQVGQGGVLNADPATPEFREWFGESKVVDAQGVPLVLYRGMAGETIPEEGVTEMRPTTGLLGTGIYMTGFPGRAAGYTRGERGQTYPLYAAIQNPISEDDFVERFGRTRRSPEENQAITDQLVSEGYDGIIAERGPGQAWEVVAFRPEQVKSVFNERPTQAPGMLDQAVRQKAGPDAPGVGLEDGNKLGFWPALRVKLTAKLKLPEKAPILTGTDNKNAARQISAIDGILKKFPKATESTAEWTKMMAYALGSAEVPIPPYAFIRDLNGTGSLDKLRTLTQGQIDDASHGFENAAEFRRAYLAGELGVETTGKLFMWSFLSRGVSPYTQEALFIDAFDGADPWIAMAARGEFTEAVFPEYEAWAKSVAPKGSGQPGAGATHNLNAFGQDFLFKMSRVGTDGKTHMQRLHDMMSDPNQTGKQIRREFATFGEGVGIDNKVVSFTLLVAGFPDVMVLDRVQIRQLWDDGRFNGVNLYDGVSEKRMVTGRDGETVEKNVGIAGSSLNSLAEGARGILVYEAIERGLEGKIQQMYADLGRPQDASIGRYHWETWVADSQQEASHGTLGAILADAKGDDQAIANVSAKQGEYGAYEYGALYNRDSDGLPWFGYETPTGGRFAFSVPAFRAFLEDIKRPRTGVVPTGFKVTNLKKDKDGNNKIEIDPGYSNGPWYNRPGVNQDRLEERARYWADRAGGSGEGQRAIEEALQQQAADGARSSAAGQPEAGGVNDRLEQAGDGAGRAVDAGSSPLPGAPVIAGATGPDPRLVAVAEQYARDNGIDLKRQSEYVKVDPERAARIAAAYEAMAHAPQDPAVQEAYQNLIQQTVAQYRALEAAGYKFWFIDPTNDPYKSPFDAMREMRTTQTMGVFPTVAGFGSNDTNPFPGNPLEADTGIQWPYGSPDGELRPVLANDLFRAVHDAFGHGLEGAGFRAQGEENAWQAHARLFTGSAVAAITTETRGQNSWVNFGPYGESNQTAKVEDTVFADQKTGLLPEWTWNEGRAGDMQSDVLEQGPRGTFSPSQLLLTLNENADLSTFLHESGHFFLEVLADLSSQPNAPQQIQDDMAATLKWFGVPDLATWNGYTLDQKRPYHERWAESFEQYLFEGKAPSPELQPLFRRFRSWLVNVYQSLTQFMRARDLKVNDEVRQVFDRLVATDEQIAQAEEAAGMLPDFDATNEAIEQLQARSLRDLKWTVKARGKVLKALEKEAKELRKEVEAEVRAEVEQQPLYKAMNWLKKGETTDPATGDVVKAEKGYRLLTTALAEMYPETMLSRPDLTGLRGMTGKEGLHPDMVADMFGFESGDKLVRAILDAEPIASVIEGMTDQRMLERHGDLATPEAREAAANEAVHNEARARSLATELKSQAEMLNPRQDTGRTASNGRAITVNAITAAAKQFAENLAARRRIKDLKNAAWQHRSAEARAGKTWQAATAKADTQAAVQAKRDQVLNNAAVKALQDAQLEVRKIVEFFKRVTKGNDEKVVERGRDPDVVNAMRAILAAYDVAPRLEKTALAYMETVAKNDPAMYAALQPSVQGAMLNAKPMVEMTMEELRGLNDELRAMWVLAKRSRQMEVDGNLIDIEDAADQLVERMGEIGIPDTIPGEKGAITDRQERGIKLQFAKAILSRVEQWSERLDGKFGGPFLRLVFQPIKDAADRYRTDKQAYRKKFAELVKNVAPSLPAGPIEAPELGYTFGNARDSGAAELLHAILHTGNDSNKRKLLLGRGWATQDAEGNMDTTQWDAFIQRMQAEGKVNKAHYDFAQGVWDLLEEMKPLAQETHRKVLGRYFAEVTANEVVTPFGTYRGGYVPAQTDSRLVKDAKLRELAEGENESMAYAFPAAPSGFTKGRVEYNQPLLLDLRALGQHMDKVLLFSHMQGAVTDVRRLLTNKRVSYALDRIDPGAYEGMLIPWLNRSARQVVETPVVGDRKISRFLSAARSRAGMALMFANLSNTVQQITGFTMAGVKVRPGLMMSATARFMADPKAMKTTVAEASPYMKDRMLNEVGAMNDAVEQILVDPTLLERGQAWTQRHAYFMQAAVDNTMSPIIWTAAYNQAIEQGMENKEAVRFADGVIRQTQGTTLPEDISRFESGPGYARLFTQFVSYFNMMANTNATAVKQIADEVGLKKGAGKVLYVAIAGLLAPIWVAEAIAQAFRGGPEDEDKDGWLDDWLLAVFGLGTLKGLTAQIPIVGQAGQLVINRFNDNPADDKFSLSPAVSLIESSLSSPFSVYKAIVEDGNKQRAVRDVAAAATMITGLPIYGVARPIGYLAGMAGGNIEPTGPADLARGLVTGTASPESKQR